MLILPCVNKHLYNIIVLPMEQQKKKGIVRDFFEAFIIALLIALPIKYFVASPFIVRQTSMFPTFKDGNYLIVDKLSYKFEAPKRGEVIVFKPPFDNTTYFIKRIVGLPGETVIVDNEGVTIKNTEHPEGFKLNEPYVSSSRDNAVTTVLDNDHYFVMGDNRSVSSDSRNWGPLPKENISGRALLRLFPLSSLDYMPGKSTDNE
ncbi:MAG: signal peptidase signal peptidase [Candidatus Taylorbacteria bacterium]|nr:signal peptidase signal peptidase [Candidatus Taylorbacteria bacterium]